MHGRQQQHDMRASRQYGRSDLNFCRYHRRDHRERAVESQPSSTNAGICAGSFFSRCRSSGSAASWKMDAQLFASFLGFVWPQCCAHVRLETGSVQIEFVKPILQYRRTFRPPHGSVGTRRAAFRSAPATTSGHHHLTDRCLPNLVLSSREATRHLREQFSDKPLEERRAVSQRLSILIRLSQISTRIG